MQIEQRHVTTINLQDGKSRDFVVLRDHRACKVSAMTREEILNLLMSPQDFQRLCQAIAPTNGHEPREPTTAEANGEQPPVSETTTPGWTTIRVDQRQVTTVALHPSRTRDVTLHRDDRSYRVSWVAQDEVVTLLLSATDYAKLRHQASRWEWRDTPREGTAVRRETPEPRRETPEPRRETPEPRRETPESRRETSEPRREAPEPRREAPEPRRETVEIRRPTPEPRLEKVEVRRDTPVVIREPHETRRPQLPPTEICEVSIPGRADVVPYPWAGIDWLGFN